MLSIVATPIGNLEDLTLRAIRTLKEADVILAEDTRQAAKLLSHLGIAGKIVLRYDEHTHERMIPRILEELRRDRYVALATDAGTPGISDPGARLIHRVTEVLPTTAIVAIPGPSAVTAALSIAGFPADRFVFLGYPPPKKGRGAFFRGLASRRETLVLFEAPHRIIKTLADLETTLGSNAPIALCRELTKLHETIYRGTIRKVTEALKSGTIKGEFVVVISPRKICPNTTSPPPFTT